MMPECAVVAPLRSKPGRGPFPAAADWESASPVVFHTDWRGEHADPGRETQVRLLWTTENLYIHFRARYREITVFADAQPTGRRDRLWDRDVAEVFLQPEPAKPRRYKEIEISPNGYWIDLGIDLDTPERKRDLHSGLRRRAGIGTKEKTWTAELVIPMKALVTNFDPGMSWRANFFRVEGPQEPRFYSAWRPTLMPQPDFHVPEAFGKLVFAGE
jgi:alpha-galactosidase